MTPQYVIKSKCMSPSQLKCSPHRNNRVICNLNVALNYVDSVCI